MWQALIKLVEKWACMHDMELIRDITVNDDFIGTYHKYMFKCRKCGKYEEDFDFDFIDSNLL